MKIFLVGLWTMLVTLGAGYAVAAFTLDSGHETEEPKLEGLAYTSLPTLSVPVVEEGVVKGYVVVRLVFTADTAVLRKISADPAPFISDETFRTLYARSEISYGRLKRVNLSEFADGVRDRVNERLGDTVIEDLLIDGLNYVDLAKAENAPPEAAKPPLPPAQRKRTAPTASAVKHHDSERAHHEERPRSASDNAGDDLNAAPEKPDPSSAN